MYRCGQCGRISQLKEKQHKKTVQTRKKVYTEHDPPTVGAEIVKEIKVCKNCKE